MNRKICILSITASHYRKRIYELIDHAFDCRFIFGMEENTVRRMDTTILHDVIDNKNRHVAGTLFYWQKSILSQTRPYSVIINDLGVYCLSGWLLMLLSKFRKQKVYLWDHGWYGREGFVKKWIKRAYFGLADGAFVYGNYAKRLMIDNGFCAAKLHVIHNSLDYDRQLALRNAARETQIYRKHFGNSDPVICFIGRLTYAKKLDMIVSALHILQQKGEKYNLVFIGDGESLQNIETIVASLGLQDKVWLYGACYDEETNAELIYNADLCVSPGNVGLTAMHAMMFGCPVITHDDYPWQMPEFEAIHPGKTGNFFRHDDTKSLAEEISKWFAMYKGKKETVRQMCFKEVDEEWNPHRQMELIKKVIDE